MSHDIDYCDGCLVDLHQMQKEQRIGLPFASEFSQTVRLFCRHMTPQLRTRNVP